MQNIYDRNVCDAHIARIDKLTKETRPLWGKMNAAQMLAHCNKPYEMVCDPNYAATHKRPNGVVRFLLKSFLKPIVVGKKPYKKNSRTAPEFIVADERVLYQFAVQIHPIYLLFFRITSPRRLSRSYGYATTSSDRPAKKIAAHLWADL